MMKRGDFPVVHVGNVVRVKPEDLERYIHNNATQGDLRFHHSVMGIKFAYGLQSAEWQMAHE